MNNEEFNNLYDDWLAHRWVTSKDAQKRAEQKKKEQEYNKKYYEAHKKGIAEQIKKNKEAGGYGSQKVTRKYDSEVGPTNTNPKTTGLTSVIYNKRAAQINKNSKNQLGMDRAKEIVDFNIKTSNREKRLLNERNARASQTSKSQGSSIRDSVRYKRQQDTLKRSGKSGSKSSDAQINASIKRREKMERERSKQRKKKTYVSAAKNERSKANRRNIDYRNKQASYGQMASVKKRSDYAKSLEGRINRKLNKAATSINKVINSGKAAKKRAKDLYNEATTKYDRIKKAVKRTASRINR